MDQQTIYWVKTQPTNDENASDEEVRADFIEGGLTEEEADEWVAKRTFYRNNIVTEDNEHNDIGIYDPKTRSVKARVKALSKKRRTTRSQATYLSARDSG